jgi:hypothetical protein
MRGGALYRTAGVFYFQNGSSPRNSFEATVLTSDFTLVVIASAISQSLPGY